MKRVVSGDTTVLKQHYEKKVHDLELEKKALQVQFLLMLLLAYDVSIEMCISQDCCLFYRMRLSNLGIILLVSLPLLMIVLKS